MAKKMRSSDIRSDKQAKGYGDIFPNPHSSWSTEDRESYKRGFEVSVELAKTSFPKTEEFFKSLRPLSH